MAKYKLRNTFSYKEDGTTVDVTVQDVLDTETKIAIPKDEANRHYQEYLAWVAEGNTAEAAD